MHSAHWFVVQTNPMRERIAEENLSDYAPYLPKFKATSGRVVPLFTSYLFVPATDHWSPIKNTHGVRALLMQGEHPARLPHTVIREWQDKERNGLVQLPDPPRFKAGEKLTVARGSLKYRTVIHTGMSTKDREHVLVDLLGQLCRIIISTRDLVSERVQHHKRLQNQRETRISQIA